MLKFLKKKPAVASTPFAEFVRNASSAEKKRVYSVVLQKATERQQRVLDEAKRTRLSRENAQAAT